MDAGRKKNPVILDQFTKPKTNKEFIRIHSPHEFPFGPLSNDAMHPMHIDGKRWETVTNYVLSNMLLFPADRAALQYSPVKGSKKKTNVTDKLNQLVANAEARQNYKMLPQEVARFKEKVLADVEFQSMDLYGKYHYFLQQETISLLRTAVEKAYNAKIQNNPNLQAALRNTGNSPIFYISNNQNLGVGEDRKGHNLIGKALMQIRHNLRVASLIEAEKANKAKRVEALLNSYKAYTILQYELEHGNALTEYLGKNALEIIQHFEQTSDIPLKSLGITDNYKEIIAQKIDKGNYPILEIDIEQTSKGKPGYLPAFLRKENIRKFAVQQIQKRNNIIFDTYVQYYIMQNYPNMSQDEVKKATAQLASQAPSVAKYNTLKETVVGLYNRNILSVDHPKDTPSVIDLIKEKLKQIHVPTKQEVKEAEDMRSQSVPRSQSKPASGATSSVENDPIKKLLDAKTHSGVWRLTTKHKTAKTYVIGEKIGEKPTPREIRILVQKYNDKGGKQVLFNDAGQPIGVTLKWYSETQIPTEDIVVEEKEEVEQPHFIKPVGISVEIYPNVKQNKKSLQPLSPLYMGTFEVDQFKYPSVALFITAMLLTQVGVKTNLKTGERTYTRGMSVQKAYKMLLTKDVAGQPSFYAPDVANHIYEQEKLNSFRELLSTYVRTAMKAKFSDRSLQNLLLLTGNAMILYTEPNDLYLGAGTKQNPGENLVGQILVKMRQEFRAQRKTEEFPVLDEVTLHKTLENDPFMYNWIKMRVYDMCKTVYRAKNYLWTTSKINEEITPNFIDHVLDYIFQPCGTLVAMSREITTGVPEYFVQLVRDCKGMKFRYTENFDQKIGDLQRKLLTLEFGKQAVSEPVNLEISEKKLAELERLKNSNASQEKIEQAELEYKNTYDAFVKDVGIKGADFEATQRKKLSKYREKLFQPELSWNEIYKRFNKLLKTQAKERKKEGISVTVAPVLGDQAVINFLEKQKTERDNLWKNLTEPKLDQKEIIKKLSEYGEKLFQRYQKFRGLKPRTKEAIACDTEKIEKIRKEIATLARRKKDEYNYHLLNMAQLSEAYWKKVVVMVYFLLDHLKGREKTMQNVREVIVKAEQLNSQKKKCQVPVSIGDKEDNCIASALVNILSGIKAFKFQYNDVPLEKADIDLASSILLNSDISGDDVEDVKIEEDVKVDVEFVHDLGQEQGDTESAEFSMRKKDKPISEVETVRILLRELGAKKLNKDLVKYFLGTVKTVKDYRLNSKVKTNRINFFATLR